MKIKKISIVKLFGLFNHEILVNKTGITIIIGENGLGKTVLLEMLEAFFKKNFYYFSKIVFEEIKFEFDDGIIWQICKKEEKGDSLLEVTQINKNGSPYNPHKIQIHSQEQIEQIASRIARAYPLRRVSTRMWEDRRTGVLLTPEDIIEKYNSVNLDLFSTEQEKGNKWFNERVNGVSINLIETQRLIHTKEVSEHIYEQTVELYSQDLSQKIKSLLTASTELSSQLDRTYPNRLIYSIKKEHSISIEELNKELNRLEERRRLLDTVGLIVIDKESNISRIDDNNELIINVLTLYIEDSFKKIEIFSEISKKIELFIDIINKRFKHKKLYIDKEKGFWFKSTMIKDLKGDYQTIPLAKLSSGEKNELVLFYRLLFESLPNSLILIDEPEISLHISWQNCFIEDLKEIAKLNQLDVLIATHSPDIIANNWNLKVELKGID